MPHYWKEGDHYYISRRSICDNCGRRQCPDRDSKDECLLFIPKEGFIFVKCTDCGQYYEIHETRKQDYADICPECDVGRRKAREENDED